MVVVIGVRTEFAYGDMDSDEGAFWNYKEAKVQKQLFYDGQMRSFTVEAQSYYRWLFRFPVIHDGAIYSRLGTRRRVVEHF